MAVFGFMIAVIIVRLVLVYVRFVFAFGCFGQVVARFLLGIGLFI